MQLSSSTSLTQMFKILQAKYGKLCRRLWKVLALLCEQAIDFEHDGVTLCGAWEVCR
jgi:hypothetical protein